MSGSGPSKGGSTPESKTNRKIIYVLVAVILIVLLFGTRISNALGIESGGWATASTSTVPYAETTAENIPPVEVDTTSSDQEVEVTDLSAIDRANLALDIFQIEMASYTGLMEVTLGAIFDAEEECQTAGSIYSERQPLVCVGTRTQCTRKNFWGVCKSREEYCIQWGVQPGVPEQAEAIYSSCMYRHQAVLADLDARRPRIRLSDVFDSSQNLTDPGVTASLRVSNQESPDLPTDILLDLEALDVFHNDDLIRARLDSLDATVSLSMFAADTQDAVKAVSIAKLFKEGAYGTETDSVALLYVDPLGKVQFSTLNFASYIAAVELDYLNGADSTMTSVLPVLKKIADDNHSKTFSVLKEEMGINSNGYLSLPDGQLTYVGNRLNDRFFVKFSESIPLPHGKLVVKSVLGQGIIKTEVPAVAIIGASFRPQGSCLPQLPANTTVGMVWDSIKVDPIVIEGVTTQAPKIVVEVDSHAVSLPGDKFVSVY